jgi:hypothetical protein
MEPKGSLPCSLVPSKHKSTDLCNWDAVCFLRGRNREKSLIPWSRIFLEKLTVAQLIKKFPTFYETRKFIIVFTRARHWSLSWAAWNIPHIIILVSGILHTTVNTFIGFFVTCVPINLHNYHNIFYISTHKNLVTTYIFIINFMTTRKTFSFTQNFWKWQRTSQYNYSHLFVLKLLQAYFWQFVSCWRRTTAFKSMWVM